MPAINTELKNDKISDNELETLIMQMKSVPNSKVHIAVNENNELQSIFFQDERMAAIFDKYPEVVIFDATYKLNNRRMPLFIMLAIDGEGNSEIACLFFIRSESREALFPMMEHFKKEKPAWEKILLGDKDWADRSIFTEVFPDASLQICAFHVMRIFNREITPSKRNISKEQRDQVLKIFQKMIYAETENEYNDLYISLENTNIESVIEYFNKKWHCCRTEWAKYGKNLNNYYILMIRQIDWKV